MDREEGPGAMAPVRIPGVLTRRDVEERERLARRRPPWTRRPRRPLREASPMIVVPVLAPVIALVAGWRALIGVEGHGWSQVLALPDLAFGGGVLVLDLLHLRRPVGKPRSDA